MLSRFVLVNVWVAWALTARTVGIGVIPGTMRGSADRIVGYLWRRVKGHGLENDMTSTSG
jgi:hypothetical protein